MDQSTPPDGDASGRVPPADPEGGQGATWGQPPPASGDDATQASRTAAEASGQEAAAEYAAWSTDASYQNPEESGQSAGLGYDASTAYAAPEPQAVTYQEQPPNPQDPSQGYDPQQQGYDPQQYQQPPAYDPQQYPPQYQQPYDQGAYQQQQQQYQQGYDQGAYGQQPGYYDQSAYGQQQGYYQQPPPGYQQQQYQQPAQPYAYAQPNQQGWPADPNYWDQASSRYGRSFLAVLAGFVLLTWGIILAVGGGMLMALENFTDFIAEANLGPETQALVDDAVAEQFAVGGIFLMLGILMVLGAIGIWAHRGWGRAIGVLLGLLGTLLGLGMVFSSVAFEVGDVTIDGALAGEAEPLGAALVVLFSFFLVFLAMFIGRRHFRRVGVAAP